MLFEEKHIGKPISEQLAKYLKEWTNSKDIANVYVKTGVSESTIRNLIKRSHPLIVYGSKAIIELMKIAVVNGPFY